MTSADQASENWYKTDATMFAEQRDEALREVKRLRAAIVEHRAQKADDRCIEDDDRLYEALQDGIKCDRRVGNKEEMLKNCERFIEKRCQSGVWPTYAELEKALEMERLARLEDHEEHKRQIEALGGWSS